MALHSWSVPGTFMDLWVCNNVCLAVKMALYLRSGRADTTLRQQQAHRKTHKDGKATVGGLGIVSPPRSERLLQ